MWMLLIIVLTAIQQSIDNLTETIKSVNKDSVEVVDEVQEETCSTPEPVDIDNLFEAISIVESQKDPNVLGDNGKARGILQMHEIIIEEINKKCFKENKYSWDDAWCPVKSEEMFKTYAQYIIDNRCHMYPDMSREEVIARTWNGSYNFKSKIKTKIYWNKVERELKNIS